MRKILILFVFASLFLAFSEIALAQSMFTVDANGNSISRSPAGSDAGPLPTLLDTWFVVHPGDRIVVTAFGNWSISPSDPFTGPAGNPAKIPHFGTNWPAGALLAQISGMPLFIGDTFVFQKTFVVGLQYDETTMLEGNLYLAFNDTDYGNNLGSVTATVNVFAAAPEPNSLILITSGIGFAAQRKRRRHRSGH